MRTIAFLALLVLAGCGNGPEHAGSQDDQAARAAAAGFRPDAPAPLATDSVDPVGTPAPGALLPPATEKWRYIGSWATDPAQCKAAAWRFETSKVKTPGGTECRFTDPAAAIGSYDLPGECKPGYKWVPDTVRLTFDEAAKRMHVDSETLGVQDLIYCGA